MNSSNPVVDLPIKRSLTPIYICSISTAVLMAFTSGMSLLYPNLVYPSEKLIQTFLPNDVINLVIGLPILILSMVYTRRGRLIGLLFWPGALLFVMYNYTAYVFGIPFNLMFIPYLALFLLGTYTSIGLVANIDSEAVKRRLDGTVPTKSPGGILIMMGILFILRGVYVTVSALLNHTVPSDLPVLVADFSTLPAWIIGGMLLWQREALGYTCGVGLLFLASMLFISLISFLLLQPILTAAPFALNDLIAVFAMGLVCFLPFGFFVRGVLAASDQ